MSARIPGTRHGVRSLLVFAALFVSLAPLMVSADCWLIEGDKGYVWLAICSQNQPPFETIPPHINSTVHDLRLNDNKLKVVLFTSMYRFTNLTDLNLTKNDISYIEDGAFANQANLQILQLGYNKLTNLTEGMLRGLGRLQCLYLQHNLLEIISTNTFWECPSLSSLDLSSNKLARLDPTTFAVLNRLTVCELAANPFHCGCDLFSFLSWLEEFNNVTHTYDRLQCETPREMFGYCSTPTYELLYTRGFHSCFLFLRSNHIEFYIDPNRTILSTRCRDGVIIPGMPSQLPDLDGSGLGLDNTDQGFYHQPNTSSTADALNKNQITMVTQAVSQYSASLRVQIPEPFSKMYILSQYNHTLVADKPLKKTSEVIMLDKLQPHTNYTYCVASVSKSQRYNHTCLSFTTRADGPEDHRANPSTTTHYIMTIVGCLFGMLLVLGFVYYCLRRRRAQEEKEKAISVKKTILEMRTGPPPQLTGPGPASTSQSASPGAGMLPGTGNSGAGRLSALPQGEKMSSAFSESPAGGAGKGADVHGSNSEISTIAKEVDKVNQIINNCIDALKLDASSPTHLPPHPHPSMAPVPLVMPLSERPGISGGGFLTPPYRDPNGINGGGVSVNGASTGCSNGSGSSGGPKAVQTAQHLEVQPDYHSSEHRHSFPALYYDNPDDSPNSKYLKPQRSRRDAPAGYAQLSPARHHNYNSGYSSSPEYSSSSESTLRIWERFKPYRKSPREEAAAYIAAGHALRKKVQFAKDEDLHDILDYWKGVSAQQKL
uniref:Extracellular leucine-rich repeat and fibronectin type III domain containing 2a n=1 Tax=Neogobius melanostomus TaxID=47308 RepID=A0A8C6TPM3_9GOBI